MQPGIRWLKFRGGNISYDHSLKIIRTCVTNITFTINNSSDVTSVGGADEPNNLVPGPQYLQWSRSDPEINSGVGRHRAGKKRLTLSHYLEIYMTFHFEVLFDFYPVFPSSRFE